MSHTTPPRSSSIVLNISPRGYRSGLISFSRFGKSLRVLVLPKLWSGLDVQRRVHLSADTLTVIAYETERLALWFQDEHSGAEWIQLIEECIDQLHATSQEQTERDTEEDELADLFTDSQIRKSLKSLIAAEQGRRPKASSAEWVKLSVIDEHSTDIDQTDTAQESLFTDHLDQLLRLVLCAQNFKAHERDYSYADHGSGYLVYEGQSESDPLRLLMTHAFIKEMQKRHREVRQSYRLETASLNVIRGQITTKGIIQHAHLGIPSVECTYDEFTAQIPLFQVIVSALDHVASGAPFPRAYRALDLVREVRTLAQSLRRELAHIPSLPLSVAAHKARCIRLKRSESSWHMALEMARLILTRSPLEFTDQTEGQGAVIWNVDTSQVWESVLKQLLDSMDSASPLSAFKKEPALPPWVGLQKKEIDLVARTSSSMYILDAKYKEKRAPSAAEQYQVFAYSLLAEDLRNKIRCGLLYATRGELTPLGETRKRSAGDDKEVDLIALAVPFPQRSALHNHESWQSWVRAQSSALGAFLLVEEDRPSRVVPRAT